MAKYKTISFSSEVAPLIGHDFSFLDSKQFPDDIKLVRVEYNPSPGIAVRLVIESENYPDLPGDTWQNQPSITLPQYTQQFPLADGSILQLSSYDPIEAVTKRRMMFARLQKVF